MGTQPYSKRSAAVGPGPVPSTGNPTLEAYCAEELFRVWTQLQTGSSQFITLEPLGIVPPNVFDGMICFFVENVVAPQRGLYEYSSGAWSKL
jgi:hypothetical protein